MKTYKALHDILAALGLFLLWTQPAEAALDGALRQGGQVRQYAQRVGGLVGAHGRAGRERVVGGGQEDVALVGERGLHRGQQGVEITFTGMRPY
jgi:hypothetical protein